MLHQLLPDVAHLLLAHLAVSNGDPGFGEEFVELCGTGCDRFHTVVDIVDLASSAELPDDRLHKSSHVVLDDVGLDGVAVLRRLLQHGHITDPAHGHVESSWDRGG